MDCDHRDATGELATWFGFDEYSCLIAAFCERHHSEAFQDPNGVVLWKCENGMEIMIPYYEAARGKMKQVKDAIIGSSTCTAPVNIHISPNRWTQKDGAEKECGPFLEGALEKFREDALEIYRVLYNAVPSPTIEALIDILCDSTWRNHMRAALAKVDARDSKEKTG